MGDATNRQTFVVFVIKHETNRIILTFDENVIHWSFESNEERIFRDDVEFDDHIPIELEEKLSLL